MLTPTTVQLEVAALSGISFFSDAGCVTPITGVTINPGRSSAGFHFRGNRLGTLRLTVSAMGLASASQGLQIVRGAGNVVAFASAPQSHVAGTCGRITLEFQGSAGTPVSFPTNTLVSLASEPAGRISFFTAANCSGAPMPDIVVAAGQSRAAFYIQSTVAGPVTVFLTATGLIGSSQVETIAARLPSVIAFSSAPQNLRVGECSSPVSIQTRDVYENPSAVATATTFSLSVSVGTDVRFYSDAGCTSEITQVTMPTGAHTARFHFRGIRSGENLLAVSSAAFTAIRQANWLLAGPSSKLVFVPQVQTTTAGVCSAAVALQLRDTFDNLAQAPDNRDVSLTVSATQLTLYTDSTCATPTTRVTIPRNGTAASLYFSEMSTGRFTVTAASSGLTEGGFEAVIN